MTRVEFPESVTNIGSYAFASCPNLTAVHAQGSAPTYGLEVFEGDNNTVVYYLPGTTGWGAFYAGRPTALWLPELRTEAGTFGVQTNQFGFNVTWAGGMTVVVEAATNLMIPTWIPLQTNTLTGGSLHFSDPEWTNHSGRFYRVRKP